MNNIKVYTKDEYIDLIEKSNRALNEMYKTDIKPINVFEEIFTENELEELFEYYKENSLSYDSPQKAVEAIMKYIKNLKSMKKMSIKMAYEAPIEHIEKFKNILAHNSKENLVIIYEIDQSIIGGAIFEFNGKYSDYSLKDTVDKIFTKEINNNYNDK